MQIGDLDGHMLARSVNLGTARLPVALVGAMLARAILMPIDRVVQRARLIGESIGVAKRRPAAIKAINQLVKAWHS